MRILSNDYRSNLPGESDIAHGGPANFARAFSAHAVKHGHTWVGLVQQGGISETTHITRTFSRKHTLYYTCSLPESRYRPFLTLMKKQDPCIWFGEEIACIRRFIRRIRPDVLFLNGFSVYAWLLLEAASKEGLPIVVQHAGIARIEFEQYKHLYSVAGRNAMLRMEQSIAHLATTQIFLNAHSLDAFSLFVTPVSPDHARIIPLPYDKTFAQKALKGKKNPVPALEEIVIGCVARWDRIKNHRAILALAKEAAAQGLPWTFKSVTRIPTSPTETLLKKAYLRILDVIPPMDREDLLAFYQSVHLMILPSHFDVSPTVVMEAALAGKPTLISTGVGWNSEYLEHGLEAWITDFSHPKRVIRKIQSLLNSPSSQHFQSMIRTKHAPNKVFAAYLRAFTDAKRLCALPSSSHRSIP